MRSPLAKRIIPVERRNIAPRDVIEFTVPMPPSTNALFANASNGRIKSRDYRNWIKEAGWIVMAARVGCLFGPVSVEITLPSNMRGDPDNRVKPILDLCVRLGLIRADTAKVVKSINVTTGPVDGAKVTIRRAA